jgi:gluconate 2-dehydrogenase gamma chain
MLVDRRRFLVNAVPTAVVTVAAATSMRLASGSDVPRAYTPTFFSTVEWAFVVAAVNCLIPAGGEGPGGVEIGVPEFIDRQMELPYGHGGYWYLKGPFADNAPETLGYQLPFAPRDLYRNGIREVNAGCSKAQGKGFADLSAEQQDAVLSALEAGKFEMTQIPPRAFFEQLVTNTREGYFADPQYGGNRGMAAWKWIGFPGARADFTDWIDQAGKVYPYGPVSIAGRST